MALCWTSGQRAGRRPSKLRQDVMALSRSCPGPGAQRIIRTTAPAAGRPQSPRSDYRRARSGACGAEDRPCNHNHKVAMAKGELPTTLRMQASASRYRFPKRNGARCAGRQTTGALARQARFPSKDPGHPPGPEGTQVPSIAGSRGARVPTVPDRTHRSGRKSRAVRGFHPGEGLTSTARFGATALMRDWRVQGDAGNGGNPGVGTSGDRQTHRGGWPDRAGGGRAASRRTPSRRCVSDWQGFPASGDGKDDAATLGLPESHRAIDGAEGQAGLR